jgi:hypothetical protein
MTRSNHNKLHVPVPQRVLEDTAAVQRDLDDAAAAQRYLEDAAASVSGDR